VKPPDADDDALPSNEILAHPKEEEARERQEEVAGRFVTNKIGLSISPNARTGAMFSISSSSGPLPSPSVLAEYDSAIPGLGERLITAFEREQVHRQQQEALDRETNRQIALAEVRHQGQGLKFAFGISVIAFVAAGIVTYFGHGVIGAIFGGVDLVALATVFIAGRRGRSDQGNDD